MAITDEQREARRRYIGSSDAAAVLGIDPYRSPADVFLEKTGQCDPFAGNEATERGNLLEPVLLDWAAKKVGGVIRRDHFVTNSDYPHLCANLDGFKAEDSAIIECKTCNNHNPDEWGAEGTDEIPERVIVQVHHQMVVMGPAWTLAYVPVLLAVPFKGFEFRMYRVERNNDLSQAIAEAGEKFWREHVIPRVPPSDFRPSIEVLKRMRREPASVVPLAPELAAELVEARRLATEAGKRKEAAETAVLAALGQAEAGDYGAGLVTYFESERKAHSVEASKFRQLRVKPAKGMRV